MNAKKDFYFSKEHRDHMLSLEFNYPESELFRFNRTTVNGIEYTEMIDSGKEPFTKNFKDLELIYSGTDYNLNLEPWNN